MHVAIRLAVGSETLLIGQTALPTGPPAAECRHSCGHMLMTIGSAGCGALSAGVSGEYSGWISECLKMSWISYGHLPTDSNERTGRNGLEYRRPIRRRLRSGNRGMLFTGSVQRNSPVFISARRHRGRSGRPGPPEAARGPRCSAARIRHLHRASCRKSSGWPDRPAAGLYGKRAGPTVTRFRGDWNVRACGGLARR